MFKKSILSLIALGMFSVSGYANTEKDNNVNNNYEKQIVNEAFIIEVEENIVVKTCTYIFKDAEGNILYTLYIPNVPDDQSCRDESLIRRALLAYQIATNP